MAGLITASSDIPIKFQGYYDRTLLENAEVALLFDLFAQQRPLPKNQGDRMNFRKYGNLAVNTTPLTEGVTPSGKKASTIDIYADIKFYGDYITVTDVLLTLGLDANILDICERLLSRQAAETKDILNRDELMSCTSVRYAGNVAARTSIVDQMRDADVEAAVQELETANAMPISKMKAAGSGIGTQPISQAYIGITHVHNRKAITQLTGFVPAHEYPSRDSLTEWKGRVVEVGSALGVRWFVTTHGKIWADGGGTAVTNNLKYTTANTACDVYGTVILAEDAYGNIPLQKMSIKTIVKKLGSAGTEDALDQRATVGWKMAEACKILDDNNLIRIESGAPKL